MHAPAPGVTLIRSPGHTPLSQLVYVRRADGRELLFVGDVASAADNVALPRMKPRCKTKFQGKTHDDRRVGMLETIALHKLHVQHPRSPWCPDTMPSPSERLNAPSSRPNSANMALLPRRMARLTSAEGPFTYRLSFFNSKICRASRLLPLRTDAVNRKNASAYAYAYGPNAKLVQLAATGALADNF